MTDTGDVFMNSVNCVSVAIGDVVGLRDPNEMGPDLPERILAVSHKVYERAGFARGERDTSRDERFRAIIRWMLKGFDLALAGTGGKGGSLWFSLDVDMLRSEELVRSRIQKATLSDLNRANKKKLRGCKITYPTLALALLVICKNSLTRGDDPWHATSSVPVASLRAMLNHFKIRCEGTLASLLFSVLKTARLIECTREEFTTGTARQWQPMGAAWTLPFLKDYRRKSMAAGSSNNSVMLKAGGQDGKSLNSKSLDGMRSDATMGRSDAKVLAPSPAARGAITILRPNHKRTGSNSSAEATVPPSLEQCLKAIQALPAAAEDEFEEPEWLLTGGQCAQSALTPEF